MTMKGIYLTEEAKKEIEAKISELQIFSPLETIAFEEILSSATIIPVEKRWQDVKNESLFTKVEEKYPNGVIIQPT